MSAKNEHGLTPQQEKFAQEVAKGSSLSDAYRASYKSGRMKDKQIHEEASKLSANPKVSQRLSALRGAIADRAELDAADITREIKNLALSDIAGIMHADGRVKLPNELDQVTRSAIASFKIDEYGRIEYKFWDKNSALERAAKILGMFEKDNKQKASDLEGLPRELLQAMVKRLKALNEQQS